MLNIGDLKKVLYCESNDKSSTTLEFGKERLFIAINSEKFGSEINRTLEYLDLQIQEIPLETLRNIKYPFEFLLEQSKFIYTMKNIGKYSEVVEITTDNTTDEKTVIFSEIGQQGKGEVVWKNKHLATFQFNKSILEAERKEIEKENSKLMIVKILDEQKCTSPHSFTFLEWLDKLVKVLEKNDTIRFSIKYDHPMKVEMDFDKLGSTSLTYFLAPRAITDDDWEGDEDLDDF